MIQAFQYIWAQKPKSKEKQRHTTTHTHTKTHTQTHSHTHKNTRTFKKREIEFQLDAFPNRTYANVKGRNVYANSYSIHGLCHVLLSNILHELAVVDFLPVFDCILIQVLQFVAHFSALGSPFSSSLDCVDCRQSTVDRVDCGLMVSGWGTGCLRLAHSQALLLAKSLSFCFLFSSSCFWRAFNSCKLVLTLGNCIGWVIC